MAQTKISRKEFDALSAAEQAKLKQQYPTLEITEDIAPTGNDDQGEEIPEEFRRKAFATKAVITAFDGPFVSKKDGDKVFHRVAFIPHRTENGLLVPEEEQSFVVADKLLMQEVVIDGAPRKVERAAKALLQKGSLVTLQLERTVEGKTRYKDSSDMIQTDGYTGLSFNGVTELNDEDRKDLAHSRELLRKKSFSSMEVSAKMAESKAIFESVKNMSPEDQETYFKVLQHLKG